MQADKKLDETRNKTRNKSYLGLALSLTLTLFKLLAGTLGNSTLLLADAVHSFSEFINECTKFLDYSIGSKPEDESHNYGHGKVTTLCVGAGALILLFASFHTISLSSGKLLMFLQSKEPGTPEVTALYAAIAAFVLRNIMAILIGNPEVQVKEVSSKDYVPIKHLSIIQIKNLLAIHIKHLSIIQIKNLLAIHIKYLSVVPVKYLLAIPIKELLAVRIKKLLVIPIKDVLIFGFVIAGIGCTFLPEKGFKIADSFVALFLSLYLLETSGKLLYKTANELIEASLDEENNLRIREIIDKTENVTGSGELKTRRIGKNIAINASVNVNNSLNVLEAAEIANLVEERLKASFTEDIYVLIKIEPVEVVNKSFKNKVDLLMGRQEKRQIYFNKIKT
ncbi:Cation efflux system protein [Methanosarcina barkeri 3]|uniref:Cation efflux system protein n=1 Tax=Methanosarcina barkeri 3 TaxID=1434107 RepID=A0A0E3SPS4_METBA|nr:cation diffusion facilitator family transporter [Methanosarcina barkeri]AKB83853.1 Cation efflux system protein [Methanosarcina barkeri 3]